MEATVAGAIITLFLISLFALNSNMIHLLRSASETANASQDLQTRVEQIRLANWGQITDPTWLTANFFAYTAQRANLPGMTETLTVTPYSSAMLATYTPGVAPSGFKVTHSTNGSQDTITCTPSTYAYTAGLQTQEMVQVDLVISWPSLYRNRQRSLTTVISQWGISK